jgi:hypothetical protein
VVHGQFQANYGRPLLAAKDAKCLAKEAKARVLAMEVFSLKTRDQIEATLQWKTKKKLFC